MIGKVLMFKAKGEKPVLDPTGERVAWVQGGQVVVADVATGEELFRENQVQDPQWINPGVLAYRRVGWSNCCKYDFATSEETVLGLAPGKVFRAADGHWASWEKKSGKLWLDGNVKADGAKELDVIKDECVICVGDGVCEIYAFDSPVKSVVDYTGKVAEEVYSDLKVEWRDKVECVVSGEKMEFEALGLEGKKVLVFGGMANGE